MFAYCENDGVNCVDATGTWAKDVHLGYFIEKPKDGTYNYIGGIYKYTGVNGVYMPYYTAKDGNRVYYGTYLWAIQCGIKPDYARLIAYYCNYVDVDFENKTAPVPFIGDQSWHFNIYWGTNIKEDSRITNSNKMIAEAKKYFNIKNIHKGIECLGKALHPIQDIFAHTRDKCYPVNPRIYVQGQNVYFVVSAWSHIGVKNVDNARVRTNQLYHTAIQSKKILSDFAKKYSFLCY